MEKWQDPQTLAIWLGIVLLVILVLIFAIILFTRIYFKRIIQEQQKLTDTKIEYQKKLLNDSVLIQEHERNRIAADLHDDLISKLNVLKLSFQTNKLLPSAEGIINESIHTARRISHDLSPPLIEEVSLEELIDDFASSIQVTTNIIFHKQNTKKTELPSNKKLQLFRIVQEVINNIMKHAKATEVYLNLHITANKLVLMIKDNGIGFNVLEKTKGLGMKNIELRSQILKANYRFKSHKNKGTTFLLCIGELQQKEENE